MAIIYELWAECKDEESIQRLADHFSGLTFTLLNGRMINWGVGVEKSSVDAYALTVSSRNLSSSGVRNLSDALETTESGFRLYAHLKKAPEFRFARVAWEAENIPMAELTDYVETAADGDRYLSLECVVDEELYQHLGSPKLFHSFREGYWWNRYRGESYQPLYSNDQPALNELCRQLLPEYFSY